MNKSTRHVYVMPMIEGQKGYVYNSLFLNCHDCGRDEKDSERNYCVCSKEINCTQECPN